MATKKATPHRDGRRITKTKPRAKRETRSVSTKRIDTPQELRARIKRLSPASPATNRFTAAWRRLKTEGDVQQEQKTPWYKTQHEHWLGWLAEWDGPGFYGRGEWNRSAALVYNHIVNPKMLVYLAEAVGVPKSQVEEAVGAALGNRRTTRESVMDDSKSAARMGRHLQTWYQESVAPDLVRVVIFRPGSAPETTTLASTLEAMREVVGGNLGGLKIAPAIYLHFDDEGRVLGKPTCAFVDPLGDVVVGTCFAVGVDDAGEPRSLDDDEIASVHKIVTPVAFVAPGRFQA